MTDRHVVITGLMGVGKSTTGRGVGDALGWPCVDSDEDIERLLGISGRELAARDGVERLHQLEAAVLIGALARPTPHVIAAAASVVEDALAVEALARTAFVVRLRLSVEDTLIRQAAGDHRRPMSEAELIELAERREPMFAQVENLCLEADLPTDELVSQIVAART